jgi:endonuclease-3 related protein
MILSVDKRKTMNRRIILRQIYRKLFFNFGPQHWWPGETPFEVIVGAILTQNTNWGNVEKAIANLKKARCLTPRSLYGISTKKLARLIKPSGYYNIKAQRLKNFIKFLFKEYGGSLQKMKRETLGQLREKILSVNGIGPETADSILLYALDKPVFVVDAYTKRILSRHQLVQRDADYETVQGLFMDAFPAHAPTFNEYHALLVRLGKEFCRPDPLCGGCPLNGFSRWDQLLNTSACERK